MKKIYLWKDCAIDCQGTRPLTDPRPHLELHLLPGGAAVKPRGAVIVCPGGGYDHLAFHEGAPVAQVFNQLGFHAFVLQYRLAPNRFPAPQQDLCRAVKLVRFHAREWGIDSDKIATLGFSAGGHLCAGSGIFFDRIDANDGDGADAFSARPDALIPCYPVISVDGGKFGHAGSGQNLLGEATDFARIELQLQVRPDTPPAFLWHTADDPGVPAQNSIAFFNALRAQNIPCALHIFAKGPHGIGLAPDYPEIAVWPTLAAEFLRTQCSFPI